MRLRFERRGWTEVGPWRVEVLLPLGFFLKSKELLRGRRTLVLPRLLDVDPVVEPDEHLGDHRRIGGGDLDLRVPRPDIDELSAVADALNRLAPQLRNLMAAERETMADLSHRLRTPLAALRLQAESVGDASERLELLGLIDRMQRSVDRLIVDARAIDTEARSCLASVARRHTEFWSVLAEEEQRR